MTMARGWMIYASLVSIIITVYLRSLPLPYMWTKTPQICDHCFEPSHGGVIWAPQWQHLLALINPFPCRHCTVVSKQGQVDY